MPAFLDNYDASFNWNGDLNLSAGDAKSTTNDGLQSLLDQIHILVASSYNDWEIYPNRGANLEDFIGEPNNKTTADAIKRRILLAIVGSELVRESDIDIRVIPVHIHRVLIIIKINALPTEFNSLADNQLLQVSVVFDSLEKEIFFLDKTPNIVNE